MSAAIPIATIHRYYLPMTNYRRNRLAGGTFFFTVNLADRSAALLTTHVDLLRNAFRYAKQRLPFTVEAVVVLPDHLHALWTLPPGDSDYTLRWRLIKTHFSRSLAVGESRSTSRQSKHERGIWQRRFWEHTIRDETDLARHIDYRLHPFQSGQARLCGARRRLAALIVSSLRSQRHIAAGSGWRWCDGRRRVWGTASLKDDGYRCALPILRMLDKIAQNRR